VSWAPDLLGQSSRPNVPGWAPTAPPVAVLDQLGWAPEWWPNLGALGSDGTLVADATLRPFVTAATAGEGDLTAAAFARLYATSDIAGDGVLTAAAYAKLYATTAQVGDGEFSGMAAPAIRGPLAQTGTGTFVAPWWARYVDVILLSGGASGQTGSGGIIPATGKGGMPGQFATTTIDLGDLHGPWSITLTVGQGGLRAANADNAAPNPGQPTTATWTGNGSLVIPGGSGTVPSGQNGGTPGIRTYLGIDYIGGLGGTGNAGAGQSPGGAGAGGNGGIFGNRTQGGPGAPGQAWLVFRQN
jgi:hypothetical protein